MLAIFIPLFIFQLKQLQRSPPIVHPRELALAKSAHQHQQQQQQQHTGQAPAAAAQPGPNPQRAPAALTHKYAFHRLAPCANFFLLLILIDPRGAWGILSHGTHEFFSANCTALLITTIYVSSYISLRPLFLMLDREIPEWIYHVLVVFVVSIMGTSNLLGVVALIQRHRTSAAVTGAWFLWIALMLLAGTTLYNMCYWTLRRRVLQLMHPVRNSNDLLDEDGTYAPPVLSSDSEPGTQYGTCPAPKSKLNLSHSERAKLMSTLNRLRMLSLMASVLVLCAVAAQLFMVYQCFSGEVPRRDVADGDPSEYKLRGPKTFLWLQGAAILLMTLYSWIPASAEDRDSAPSDTDVLSDADGGFSGDEVYSDVADEFYAGGSDDDSLSIVSTSTAHSLLRPGAVGYSYGSEGYIHT